MVLFVIAVLLGTSAFAKQPSPRTLARMAWDVPNGVGVLFGGRGAFDDATGVAHASDETWLWNGARWVERFPRTVPPARSAHTMVFDSTRGRVVMFGGRQEPADRDSEPVFLNDTWVWKDDNWTKLESAENPSPRHFAGLAYDSDRDRIILYGGTEYAADGINLQQDHETWEFDGSQWTKVTDEPKVAKPLLAYDPVLKKVIMVGLSESGLDRVMYAYDPASHTWSQYPTATTLPTCVNEGHLTFQDGRLTFIGGVCGPTNTPTGQEVFEFDGTNWVKVVGNTTVRTVGEASAYDPLRDQVVLFGGTLAFSSAIGSVTTFVRNGQWSSPFFSHKPSPRSLATFTSDPVNNTVWMFGGLDENSAFYYGDAWGFRNGQWYLLPDDENSPGGGCETPLSAFDSDRNVIVVTCAGTETYEWNGTKWSAKDPQNDPP
ncbi:MAG TPA: kelch repeat-containing protein, partial [Thermoanaerobaculia bacterium]|nr:kelch repeat-containing protein [Thermoanaerobaculia bacterium]